MPGNATRERMLGRDASHVHVVPLRAPGGSVDGMITLEASCKAATGQEFPNVRFAQGSFDVVNAAAGVKVNVAGKLLLDASVLVKLNSAGLRDRLTPLAGLEYAF